MGIESMIPWAPHYSFRKRHGWILCWTPSSLQLRLLEDKVCSNQFSLVRYLEYSLRCSRMHQWWLPVTKVHFWSGSHPVSWMLFSTSVACFVSSRTPALLSQVARCVQMLATPFSAISCCGSCCCCYCCYVRQLLFNVTLGAGPGVASLSNTTRSPFWEITRSIQSPGTVALVMIANVLVCQNRNPWSCTLDNLIRYTASWLRFQQVW